MTFWAEPGDREGRLGPWNTIRLDGGLFPDASSYDDPRCCIVTVQAAVRCVVDRRKIKDGDGHKLVSEGYQPDPIILTVRMWRREQYEAYQSLLPRINPKVRSKKLVSHKIEYPDLTDLWIGDVYITKISTPEDGDQWGMRVARIECIEVFDAKKKSKKIKATKDTEFSKVGIDGGFVFDTRPQPR